MILKLAVFKIFFFFSILVSAQVAMDWDVIFGSGAKVRNPIMSSDGKGLLYIHENWGTIYIDIESKETPPQIIESLKKYGSKSSSRFHLLSFDGEVLYFFNRFDVQGELVDQLYSSNFLNGDFDIPKPTSFEKIIVLENLILYSDLGNKHKVFVKKQDEKNNNIYEVYLTSNGGVVSGILPKALVQNGIENLTIIGDNGLIFQYKVGQSIAPELYLSIRENGDWSIPVQLEFADRYSKKKDIPKYLEKESISQDGKGGYRYVLNPDGRPNYNEAADFIVFASGNKIVQTVLPNELKARITHDYPDKDSLTRIIKPSNQVELKKNEVNDISPKNYAILIGIEDYLFNQANLVDLSNPISDAENLKTELVSNYKFEEDNISVLKNPDRAGIINAFENISKQITEKDNLLIFYAGHGVWDEKLKIGYWLSADATTDSKSNWISNSTVRDYIAGLNTKHTLLISDACFSGSIFKTREVGKSIDDYGFYRLNKLPSRKAMTSGTLNTVPDDSKFMKYLLKALAVNEKEYFPSKQLFHEIEIAIINNTSNVPQFGTIQNTGDEGGDFIFIKREKE